MTFDKDLFLLPQKIINDLTAFSYFEKSIKLTSTCVNVDRYIIGLNLPTLKKKSDHVLPKEFENIEEYFNDCFHISINRIGAPKHAIDKAMSCSDINEFYISSIVIDCNVYHRVYFGSRNIGWRYQWLAGNSIEYSSRKYTRKTFKKNEITDIFENKAEIKNIVTRWLELFYGNVKNIPAYIGESKNHSKQRNAVGVRPFYHPELKIGDRIALIGDTFDFFDISDTSFLKDRHLINSTLRWIQFGYESDGGCFFTIYYLAK